MNTVRDTAGKSGRRSPVRILFACVENSNRSQLAEAFGKMHAKGDFLFESAGSRPSGRVSPQAISALHRRGYDAAVHRSKGFDAIADRRWDAVITMGCGEDCPVVAGRLREDWALPDPAQLEGDAYERVVDEIERQVLDLLRRLAP